ncbi:bifunctional 4-hydroxy-2-oxoglutarate aldolase/2-dehydro-3-deoxy-phosphogluconate aldolase [Carnobacterium funditum]|uniref:bifunctional 4-hydroxy-2-oxoglutarate aldolase/2-dehydro-3-deoxy-phosphogluconate aldolase n=1 Tax=Carnobacterium funditum TaxID=2752 RepID=UPI000557414C|nr:bifunctional 4-hydroxy-2-oxoglutarate aldolase/2-dehydro-3-deoxy-phosphogluconate aldolase [Carnobacterium funditum]
MKNIFPKVTIILRGYEYEQVKTVMDVLKGKHDHYALEITLNSPDVFTTINKISKEYGNNFYIGAGTILSLEDANNAIDAGAKFILSPIKLSREILEICKQKSVLSIPAAMTPTEVMELKMNGADIIKIFPVNTVGEKFFNDIQAPLGKLPLMAVGGVTLDNTVSFFENGADYVGIASGIFNKGDILTQNSKGLKESLLLFENKVFK